MFSSPLTAEPAARRGRTFSTPLAHVFDGLFSIDVACFQLLMFAKRGDNDHQEKTLCQPVTTFREDQ
jgi:hypothetical protein